MAWFASGLPSGTMPSTVSTRCTDDQIVVSVGPYMFIRWPLALMAPFSSRASGACSASPPTIMRLRPRRPSAAAGSSSSMRAIDGVHCRCVAWWRLSSVGME